MAALSLWKPRVNKQDNSAESTMEMEAEHTNKSQELPFLSKKKTKKVT